MAEKQKKNCQITFGKVSVKWLKEKKKSVSNTSYLYYEQVLQNELLLELSQLPIEKVNNKEFLLSLEQQYIAKGYAQNTIANFLGLVKGIISDYNGKLRAIGKYPKKAVDKGIVGEIKKIISIAKDDEYYINYKKLGILIILYTGMTISELTALRWNCIDFINKTIFVYQKAARVYNTNSKSY